MIFFSMTFAYILGGNILLENILIKNEIFGTKPPPHPHDYSCLSHAGGFNPAGHTPKVS